MSDNTKIEWCDATWNPVTGCTRLSEGCDHCYARRMARRLKAMGVRGYEDGFAVRCHEDRLEIPLHWRRSRRIFVCSMGDLFHDDVPLGFLKRVMLIPGVCRQHTFIVLTKRPKRMRTFAVRRPFAHNVWIGVTVETAWNRERIDYLRATRAHIKFVSFEPLLSPIGEIVGLHDLDWVVVGCESGPGARRTEPDWIREIKNQCVEAGVPFFLKQMMVDGSLIKVPEFDGRVWVEFPKSPDATESVLL